MNDNYDDDDDRGLDPESPYYIIDPIEAAQLAKRGVEVEVRRAVHVARYGEKSLIVPTLSFLSGEKVGRTRADDPLVREILDDRDDPLMLALLRNPRDPILHDLLRDKVEALLRRPPKRPGPSDPDDDWPDYDGLGGIHPSLKAQLPATPPFPRPLATPPAGREATATDIICTQKYRLRNSANLQSGKSSSIDRSL
jgi:hypothetical protein